MEACLMLFLSSLLANIDLVSMTQNNTADCKEVKCAKNGGGNVYECVSSCGINMIEINFTCPAFDVPATVTPRLDGVTGLLTGADTINSTLSPTISTAPTTVPTVISTNATSTKDSNTTSSIRRLHCQSCPENCTACRHNPTTNRIACTKCKDGYTLNGLSQCYEQTGTDEDDDDSSDNLVGIVLGSVFGGLALVIVAVFLVCWIKRKRSKHADVSGQCQLRVVSSDQLNDDKPKGPHQSMSAVRDSEELNKLPMAPAPPINYDQLGIADDQQLDYVPFDVNAAGAVSSNQESVYMNSSAINSNSGIPPRPSDKSLKPGTTTSHDLRLDSPEIDNVYTNENAGAEYPQNRIVPSSGLNDFEKSLEMDDIYINEEVEDVQRPSASRSKPTPNKVEKVEPEPTSLVQDDIYCNDPALNSPSEPDQLYEVPEGGLATRESDIYINANPDSIYENIN